MASPTGHFYKYVWLDTDGTNLLGEAKGKTNVDGNRIYEPTLDQLTEAGWEPFRELVVNTRVLIILKRHLTANASGLPPG